MAGWPDYNDPSYGRNVLGNLPQTSPYGTRIPSEPATTRINVPPLQPPAGVWNPSASGGTFNAPQPKPQPNPSWNTDGYAAPQHTAAGISHAIPGFDRAKWGDSNHQTPKYVVGRILSHFAPRTSELPRAFGEIRKAYPQATFDGKDKIDLDGPGPMAATDVLEGASVGGKRWRFGSTNAQASQGGGGNVLQALMALAQGMGPQQQAPQQADPSEFLQQIQQLFSQYQTQSQPNGPRIVWG